MHVNVEYRPSYAMAKVILDANESVVAESGSMVSMSSNIGIKTSSQAAGGKGGVGGFLKGMARSALLGESFFLNTFTAQGQPGEVILSPTLPGDVTSIPLNGELQIQGTSYMASSPGINIETKFGGLKTMFGGEGLFMIKASGQGEVILSSFGAIHPLQINGPYIVDTGHIVAFDTTLNFEVKKVGSWKATFLSGEGLVTLFNGKGRLWIQSRNPKAFGGAVGHKLPPRRG